MAAVFNSVPFYRPPFDVQLRQYNNTPPCETPLKLLCLHVLLEIGVATVGSDRQLTRPEGKHDTAVLWLVQIPVIGFWF